MKHVVTRNMNIDAHSLVDNKNEYNFSHLELTCWARE